MQRMQLFRDFQQNCLLERLILICDGTGHSNSNTMPGMEWKKIRGIGIGNIRHISRYTTAVWLVPKLR